MDVGAYDKVLARASEIAQRWLSSVQTRPVPAAVGIDDVVAVLGGPLPDEPSDPVEVLDLLARGIEPGLVAMGSGRFFGFVIGGTLPVALGTDWLVSAWDQNTGLRSVTTGTAGAEEVAGAWLLDLLGLPAGAAVGFTTGATMANFTGLAAARQALLTRAGWDLDRDGLFGAPRMRVLVGVERHDTIDLELKYLGLGAPETVPADDQGRVVPEALEAALQADPDDRPTLVVLQAGNIHSGDCDPFPAAIEAAHRHGAWVHVDGAFGLWAAASPRSRHLVAGVELADSWATDAHKTLNVPYDCGVVIVRDPAELKAAMSLHADYLLHAVDKLDPIDLVPELSRRAHGVPTWAVLRTLGRRGVAALVDGLVDAATALTGGLQGIPGVEVLHDVVFTQVTFAVGDAERTQVVAQRLHDDGTAWVTGSRWHDRPVLRLSVSNAHTSADDVAATVEAIRRATFS
ncbi:MAG TPA: aminotransferase class V-fold PLP-dependent enzyme [Mycobacteriales bacterium]|nr:aminotransferase class V-fold PLP-dependent enzyme [Mycobacteriales bacterium]